jgi:hypothetical protein
VFQLLLTTSTQHSVHYPLSAQHSLPAFNTAFTTSYSTASLPTLSNSCGDSPARCRALPGERVRASPNPERVRQRASRKAAVASLNPGRAIPAMSHQRRPATARDTAGAIAGPNPESQVFGKHLNPRASEQRANSPKRVTASPTPECVPAVAIAVHRFIRPRPSYAQATGQRSTASAVRDGHNNIRDLLNGTEDDRDAYYLADQTTQRRGRRIVGPATSLCRTILDTLHLPSLDKSSISARTSAFTS